MNRRIAAGLALALLLAAGSASAAAPPPTLQLPGKADAVITPAALTGADHRDVRVEESAGDTIVYHGLSLLEILEKAGLDSKSMPAQRRLASGIVVATARDGYTAVFSVGELLMNRGDPRVFLVAETAAGPLPEDKGPVRLIVLGDRARSAYALASIELKFLSEPPPKR